MKTSLWCVLLFCLFASSVDAQTKTTTTTTPAVWNYAKGGADWSGLCSTGAQQSPIDITEDGIPAAPRTMRAYYRQRGSMENNGRGLQYNLPNTGGTQPFGFITIGKDKYIAQDVLFRSPSEHTLNGDPFDMEMQIVHLKSTGSADRAIFSLFFSAQDLQIANAAFDQATERKEIERELDEYVNSKDLMRQMEGSNEDVLLQMAEFARATATTKTRSKSTLKMKLKSKAPLTKGRVYLSASEFLSGLGWARAPNNLGEENAVPIDSRPDLNFFLPTLMGEYYTYNGSLTAPPCTEAVQWFVFPVVHLMTTKQLQVIKDIFMVVNATAPVSASGRKMWQGNNRQIRTGRSRSVYKCPSQSEAARPAFCEWYEDFGREKCLSSKRKDGAQCCWLSKGLEDTSVGICRGTGTRVVGYSASKDNSPDCL